MYSSALSQPGLERGAEGEPGVEAGERVAGGENQPQGQSINDILMTSQTLDTVPLTPEVVGPPPQLPRYHPHPPLSWAVLHRQSREERTRSQNLFFCQHGKRLFPIKV